MRIKKLSFFIITLLVMVTLFISGCNNQSSEENITESNSDKRIVTDMANREVEIPAQVNKVYSTNSIGTIFVYTLEPDALIGWNSKLGLEKKFINEKYHDLPILGTYKGPNSINTEELFEQNPDIIINMGDVDERYISEADELQSLTNIPVLMVDGSLDKQSESYKFLGDILNKQDKAEKLAKYSDDVLDTIQNKVGNIKEEDKKEVYYAAGSKGLETSPAGSINTEVLDLVGGLNAANTGIDKQMRRIDISLEQLISWDPEIIIISPDSADDDEVYEMILNDPSWKHIEAVKNEQVYEIPNLPFDWFNRPPSVMRLMGLTWLGDLLYPDVYEVELENEMRDFFTLFFDYDLTDEDVEQLLERSTTNG